MIDWYWAALVVNGVFFVGFLAGAVASNRVGLFAYLTDRARFRHEQTMHRLKRGDVKEQS